MMTQWQWMKWKNIENMIDESGYEKEEKCIRR